MIKTYLNFKSFYCQGNVFCAICRKLLKWWFYLLLLYLINICWNSEVFPDDLDILTGPQARELQKIMTTGKSVEEIYSIEPRNRGPGTRDDPTEVPSAFNQRLIGCICENSSMAACWMWLHKDQPKRCQCGFWFKLVPAIPAWDVCNSNLLQLIV